MVSASLIERVGVTLNSDESTLAEKFRALFALKQYGGEDAIKAIGQAFRHDSALLKHELAYCLGQMQDPYALQILIRVLEDTTENPMVRHEAGEALGAIGDISIMPILEKYTKDPIIEVAETCSLAVQRLKWLQNGQPLDDSPFAAVDPTPSLGNDKSLSYLREIYLDERKSLFERYQALFSLRNKNDAESALVITEGLDDTSSALFKHEVAYVLGQVQQTCTIPALKRKLADKSENEMVRHECAEALGSIASDECRNILNQYMNDESRVVRESCEVALDMCEFHDGREFHFPDILPDFEREKQPTEAED